MAGPPINIHLLNLTESTVTLRWQHPDAQSNTSLTQYIIRAIVKNTYAKMTPLPLEWTVQKESSAKMELVNLQPGTTYNITITSDSEKFGEGGTNWIKVETEIGTPDPEPEHVRVLSQKGENDGN